ncbi:hypothetical protein GCM10017620_11850 [Brevundimonas intermedia]|uniref:Uncharacterized protein n=1 Tax=Brevundimonas intermedia TaxID=74315 RepID=A0ABQ5T6K2_9CAUL|nr:hypothetical protein GCM10017620_11850 [Brevundimonas intermedia]
MAGAATPANRAVVSAMPPARAKFLGVISHSYSFAPAIYAAVGIGEVDRTQRFRQESVACMAGLRRETGETVSEKSHTITPARGDATAGSFRRKTVTRNTQSSITLGKEFVTAAQSPCVSMIGSPSEPVAAAD